ncbi:response regulator [Chitinimonas prasina]|uniref:Response regulator n=1 Tax=Chitinimonas prasina TaxID=1434937 RepID=A0ABQ5Y9W1_9NEIS|nr:response regulator [Chitinimonas prasina]GLR11732.1 response regulator [Chitinimonas prasina]
MTGDKPTFYVIDDDSVLRSLIRGILTNAGLDQAGAASSGEEGLKGCQDKQPDLVLLDINLPGSSGMDVLATLKRMKHSPRIIMISSEATLTRVKSAMTLGAAGFVVKPFTAAKLIAAVDSALKGP